jgi:HAD superfamily hydrolase (TIGR01509 family)
MTISGVLFDFSGTLFHLDPGSDWVDHATGPDGRPLDRAVLIDLLTSPNTPSEHLPPELAADWERRDLDGEVHRMVYLAALRAAHPGTPEAAFEAIYDRLPHPESWRPYPDTLAVLRDLRAAGIPVAVVSNIPWDIRDVFRRNEMFELVEEYVLSYAEGVMKPDPKIFLTACQRIGIPPEHTLMVGDSEQTDGGATRIGCRFAMVQRVPPAERPNALNTSLRAHRVLA